MTKKRRIFDIAFEDVETPVPAGTEPARRGPMAAAITENAEALAARQTAETAIRAENDALAHELVRLKKAGLVTDLIPLDSVMATKLTRDRLAERDDQIDELKASILALGLSNPIRVEQAGDGYELIQGYRRLTAYRELLADTKDPIYATIPAAINASGETVQQLYRRMVDENLVRRDISFGEMAQLALSYHNEDPQVGSIEAAIALLYASSGRQRRHYIRQFARLLEQIGEHLAHVDTLPRALGLDVLKRIDDRPKEIRALAVMLAREPQRTAEDETRILKAYLLRKPVRPKSVAQKTAKTTFRLNRPEGAAKCTAADGRLELQLDRDFSAIERQRLEAAVEAFFNQLDEDSGDSVPAGTD